MMNSPIQQTAWKRHHRSVLDCAMQYHSQGLSVIPMAGKRPAVKWGEYQQRSATEDELKAIDKDIKAIVNESAEFAKTSPEPDLSELWTDIYADA